MLPSFRSGIHTFLASLGEIFRQPLLRGWYLRAVIRTFIVAIAFLLLALGLGSMGIWQGIGGGWLGGLGALLWIAALIFLSGTLTVSILNLFIVLISGESGILKGLGCERSRANQVPKREYWRIRRNELFRVLLSIVIALSCWPFLFFIISSPIAIVLYSWSMGREAEATGLKLHCMLSGSAAGTRVQTPKLHAIGLALIPALAALIPLLGWALLPVLPYAGLRSRQRLEKIQ